MRRKKDAPETGNLAANGPIPDQKLLIDPPTEPFTLAGEPLDGTGKPFPVKERVADGRERLAFQVTPDGRIDVEGFRAKTRERVKEVLRKSVNDPGIRTFLGITDASLPPEENATRKFFTPEFVGRIFDGLQGVIAHVLVMRSTLVLEEKKFKDAMRWTPEDHKFIDPTGADLAAKYIPPEWIEAGGDLVLFFGSLYVMQQMKFNAAMTEFHAREKTRTIDVSAAPAPGATPTESGDSTGADVADKTEGTRSPVQ